MVGRQRILVVSDQADEAELLRIRADLGRDPVVLTAPTADARRVVQHLTPRAEPQVDVLLAPVTYPPADRGHHLDALVRSHALHDRFREVVVVTDLATSRLLLRALAPDQLATGRAVTVVGLPRGDRPVALTPVAVGGAFLGVVAGLADPQVPVLALPGVVALAGVVLMFVPSQRHLGRELLIASAVALVVALFFVTSSQRFPGAF